MLFIKFVFTACRNSTVPVHSGGHWQLYVFTPSTHIPPFMHLWPGQSSTLFSQLCPSNPERWREKIVMVHSTDTGTFRYRSDSLLNIQCPHFHPLNTTSHNLNLHFPQWFRCGTEWAVKRFSGCLSVYIFSWQFPHHASTRRDPPALQRSVLPAVFACFIISHSFNDFLSGKRHFLFTPQRETRRPIK